MFYRKKLWRGLSGLFAALLALMIFATLILFDNAAVINDTFKIKTSKIDGAGEDYYKSDYGELTPENLKKVEADAEAQAVREEEEGAVLLKNVKKGDMGALPLNVQTEKRVSLFGRATYEPLYRTNAACTRVTDNNPDRIVSLNKALTDAGFDVNQTLYNAYASGKGKSKLGYSYSFEEPLSFYNAQQSSLANYKDVAIIMLTRHCGEGEDLKADQSALNAFNKTGKQEVANSLALQANERDMIDFVTKQGFGKVIVLINTNNMMELGWLNEYNIDACLYIGTPGLTGFTGVVNVLTGKDGLVPSGRLVDTYAANSLSSPAIVNAADNISQWVNYNTTGYPNIKDVMQQTSYVSVQQESIYVGYKYYETRYADAIMGDNGAKSAVGSSDGKAWNYANEMCYPFGFGLSYTTFKQTITSCKDNEDSTYTVKVRVENTGSVAAKDVIQIYVNTPYDTYEKTNKIEKPAILLVAFDKTDVIQPGDSVEIDVEVEEYLFASYDYTTTKGYVLTEGDYYFAVGRDAHSALNNVLYARDYKEGLIDHDGNAVTVNSDDKMTYKFHKGLDTETYKYGEDGKTEVTNRFGKMDINYWEGNSVKYLTRSDWEGSFPTEKAKATLLSGEMATLLQGDFYQKPADAPSTSVYAQGKNNNWQGKDNGISFFAMSKVDYENYDEWNKFIDQFSLDDLVLMTANYFGNKPIEGSVNLPEKYGGDGCQGVGDTQYSVDVTGGDDNYWPCLYTSVLSSTFSKELIENRGKLMANQALYLNATVIWTGGGNLHRTPYGGRNAEYYSEDANLTYLMSYIELSTMEARGIMGGIKHFAGNDQETQREGLNTFYNEQAFREGALRGFEGALRKGKVHSVMQAFNRQGVVFSSSCRELNVEVLREEWGFRGQVITDASSGAVSGFKSHYTTTMANGTDIYCLDGKGVGGNKIAEYIKSSDDGVMLGYLRESAKNVAYALSRSAAINGLTESSKVKTIIPAWQILVIVATCLIGILAAGSIAMFGISTYMTAKNRNGNSVDDGVDGGGADDGAVINENKSEVNNDEN